MTGENKNKPLNPEREAKELSEESVKTPEPETIESEKKEEKAEEPRKKKIRSFYDWLEVFAVSIAIIIVLFSCVGRPSTVNGSSMFPTLQDGNKVIICKLFYTPKRGDIIAIQKEEGFTKPIVKRVIATGGETVLFDFADWKVTVRTADGTEIVLDEPYINYEEGSVMNRYSVPYSNEVTVPEGYLFVMGDNRNGSSDSREAIIGLIAESEVLGHVIFRFSPLSEIGPVD